MRIESAKVTPRKHVHIHGLGSRIALLIMFSAFTVAGIAVGVAFDMRQAITRDAGMAAERLAPLVQLTSRAFIDDAHSTVNDVSAAAAIQSSLPSGAAFGIIDSRSAILLRGPENDKWVGKILPEADLAVEILSRKSGSATITGVDGVKRLYAFVPLAHAGSPSWYVYVGIPTDLAFASVRDAAYRAAAIALLLGIVALWAALTLGDLLVLRRVRRLVEAMREVAVGDKGSPDDIPGGMGELDELTAIFDRMHRKLIDSISNTDQKVLTRTADLEFNKDMAELEKARTEALISSIGEGLVATDKEGRIMFINQEAEDAMGWTSAELVGQKEEAMLKFLDDDGHSIAQELRPTRIALRTGERSVLAAFPKPYSLICKDGSTYPVNVTVSPVAFGKEIIGAIEVIRDITDEAEFDKRKSEFISIASHQLRSPLAATKWLTDMLRKGDLGPLQPKQQEMVDKLFVANERMVVLVNELLNISRLDSGMNKPAPKPTDMVVTIEEAMAEAMPLLAAKKQAFAFAKKPLPMAMFDGLLIHEVIANLISNASKYSKDGGTLTLGAELRGNELLVSVKDDGIGIPKADQNQLFKKFFRAENALKSAVQGTGLGLYFVKSVVELSGGKIWFTSEEKKGTTFFFTLPVVNGAGR